jgi:formamidopyrimidine-DNA glycosylase
MPELAEVERSRRLWEVGQGAKVLEVIVRNQKSRVFRSVHPRELADRLTGQVFFDSEVKGKQMVFQFGKRGEFWLGLHLGMTGELRVEKPRYRFLKYDHLILRQSKRSLVFADQRQFGRVRFAGTETVPEWWSKLPPGILSAQFNRDQVADFCRRRSGSSLKGVLLMQERFPGIGNWMADEILWRARLNPKSRAGSLGDSAITQLYQITRRVCTDAIKLISKDWELPKSWLFSHRWEDGGKCPRCHRDLVREIVAGRRTCWCPSCQNRSRRSER